MGRPASPLLSGPRSQAQITGATQSPVLRPRASEHVTSHGRPGEVHGPEMAGGAWCIRVDLIPSLGFLPMGDAFPAEVRGSRGSGRSSDRCDVAPLRMGEGAASRGLRVASPRGKEPGDEASPGPSGKGTRPCRHLDFRPLRTSWDF